MADHAGENEKHEPAAESLIDKITEKFHGSDLSSSDSDDDADVKSTAASVKAKIYRLFGREGPVHKVLGGGKRIYFFYPMVVRFEDNKLRRNKQNDDFHFADGCVIK